MREEEWGEGWIVIDKGVRIMTLGAGGGSDDMIGMDTDSERGMSGEGWIVIRVEEEEEEMEGSEL